MEKKLQKAKEIRVYSNKQKRHDFIAKITYLDYDGEPRYFEYYETVREMNRLRCYFESNGIAKFEYYKLCN